MLSARLIIIDMNDKYMDKIVFPLQKKLIDKEKYVLEH